MTPLIWNHPQPTQYFLAKIWRRTLSSQKLTEELPEGDLEKQKKGKVIKFGWIEGVYVSILNYLLKSVKTLSSFSRWDASWTFGALCSSSASPGSWVNVALVSYSCLFSLSLLGFWQNKLCPGKLNPHMDGTGEQVHWRLVDLPTGGCQPLSQGSGAAIWSQLGISLLGKA